MFYNINFWKYFTGHNMYNFLVDTYLFYSMFIHSTGQSEIVLLDTNTFQLDI